jgi:hypothetical protein
MSKHLTQKSNRRDCLSSARTMGLVLLMLAAMFTVSSPLAIAQLEVPNGAVVPPPPEEPINPSAQSRINQSLDLEAQSPDQTQSPGFQSGEARPTGDPVLDEVLNIIRQRGSVLRGSELDLQNQPMQTPRIAIIETEDPLEPINGMGGEFGRPSPGYLAAEQLLKSARNLERLNATNERTELIRAMRSHAAKLLIDAISQDTQTLRP